MTDINRVELSIWERNFELPIIYEHYTDDPVTKDQTKELNRFLAHKKWIIKAKEAAEAYCKEQVMQDENNEKKDNIFSYLKPDHLYITKGQNGSEVAIMCKYRYDLEHGLAVVFSHNGDVRVVIQDEIL